MKKVLAILIVILLVIGLSACNKKKANEETPIDMKPSFTQEELESEVDFHAAETDGDIATAESGEVFIKNEATSEAENVGIDGAVAENTIPTLSFRSTVQPDAIWADTPVSYGNDEFTLPDAVQMDDGSLGTLNIPKIGLKVSIYETDDEIEAMSHGVAHMKETSCWSGNVGIAGHNRGVNTYFGQIHTLNEGDTIKLTTALGTRTYKVVSNKVIGENDWSSLGRTEDNQITLITCVDYDGAKRLCIKAVEA